MFDDISAIKHKILLEKEEQGSIDPARWTAAYPEHRDEIIDFISWADATWDAEAESEILPDTEFPDPAGIAQRALNWVLETYVRDVDRELAEREESLAASLARAKSIPQRKEGAGPAFKRAAVYGWTCAELLNKRGATEVSRYAVGKVSYLLEIGLGLQLFTRHRRMAYGPYDPALRYRDAEPIAIDQQGWLLRQGRAYEAGPNLKAVYRYAPGYLKAPVAAEEFVEFCAQFSDETLETWTTALMAALEVQRAGGIANEAEVINYIRSVPEWSKKLRRRNFTSRAVREALEHLRTLEFL